MQLGCSQRAGQCGIGIAVDHQGIRYFPEQDVFHAGQCGCGHLRMAATTNTEIVVRPRDVQFLKENVGHVGIVVLAGVDEHMLPGLRLPNSRAHEGFLDDLGAGTHERDDFHALLFGEVYPDTAAKGPVSFYAASP